MISAQRKNRAFTLIELLVVIGILAVLLAIVLIAINPARQFSQANNTKRRNDVLQLLNAVHQYAAENRGNLVPLSIPQESPSTAGAQVSGQGVNICSFLVPRYISALPVDPLTNNGTAIASCSADPNYATSYRIIQSVSDNRLTVEAPAAELGETITVTR